MFDSTAWLWPGWIPKGQLSLICGPPDAAKTKVAAWLAAMVLRGGPCPDGARPRIDPNRPVVWLDTEGNYKRLRDLLFTIEFPRDRVFWPVDPQKPDQDCPVNLQDERWLEIVAKHAAYRRPAWVIVDRLGSRRGEVVPGTYRTLEVMAKIAQDVGSAITFLYNQDETRTTGPGRVREWAAIAEKMAAIIALKRSHATNETLLKVIKTDFGDRPDPLWLRLDARRPAVVRKPEPRPRTALDLAVSFLEGRLVSGARPAVQVIEEASKYDIATRTLQRAKRKLEVKSYVDGRQWWWILD